MTCLVSSRQYEHAHFIDAAGGGYASAAKKLKDWRARQDSNLRPLPSEGSTLSS